MLGTIRRLACIVEAHWRCCRVMEVSPSSSCLIRLKLSTITPMKRLIAKMYEKNIHAMGKSAESEKSFRPGATPASVAPMMANIGTFHSSAELIT